MMRHPRNSLCCFRATSYWRLSGRGGVEASDSLHREAYVPKKLQPDTALWGQITHYLQGGYSLEQIAASVGRTR